MANKMLGNIVKSLMISHMRHTYLAYYPDAPYPHMQLPHRLVLTHQELMK